MSHNFSPMIASAIAMQADLTRAIATRKEAAGLVNETEFRLYVTLFTGTAVAGIKSKTKEMKSIKTALSEAGRSDRNIENVVKVLGSVSLRKSLSAALAAPEPLPAVFAALAEKKIDSVTSLRRAAGTVDETDKLAAIMKAYSKLDENQQDDFAAWLAAGAPVKPTEVPVKSTLVKSRENSLKKLVEAAKKAA